MSRCLGPPGARVLAVVLVALVAACGGPIASGQPSGSTARSLTPPQAESPEPTPAPTPPPSPAPTIAAEAPPLALQLVAEGFSSPISLTADATGRIYVNEQAGRVMTVEPDGSKRLFLEISDRVTGGGERGLLGLALHPAFPGEPRIFAHYTDLAGDTVLSEFGLAPLACPACPPIAAPESERMILQVDQPFANHNGGQLSFGPDGFLYLGLGDGGSGGDPHGHGQDPGTLLGSILRIDVSHVPDPGAAGYQVPPDNPFVNGGGAPEVYVYGLRNPWRFSFDRATGDLWIGDVGQGAWEEVDRLTSDAAAAANLGWNLMEGAHCFRADPCDTTGLVLPLAEYGRDAGQSVIAGHVYRGEAIAGLRGWFLFADFYTGLLFGLPSDAAAPAGAALTPRVLLETGMAVSSFAEGPDGEIYIADFGGGIYRVVAGG